MFFLSTEKKRKKLAEKTEKTEEKKGEKRKEKLLKIREEKKRKRAESQLVSCWNLKISEGLFCCFNYPMQHGVLCIFLVVEYIKIVAEINSLVGVCFVTVFLVELLLSYLWFLVVLSSSPTHFASIGTLFIKHPNIFFVAIFTAWIISRS